MCIIPCPWETQNNNCAGTELVYKRLTGQKFTNSTFLITEDSCINVFQKSFVMFLNKKIIIFQ